MSLESPIVILYWVLAGGVFSAIMSHFESKNANGPWDSALLTKALKRLFWFVAGGALLPMTLLIFLALAPAAHFGARAERKAFSQD